ncbi:hypothetical protein OIU79_018336 [Salix purpurea]|uniref:Uncharacterized protein n=1 Tax=Salix purpurea TaxID=77065 RepID=A0A9Q0X0N2_SALPP|nr:hypothetical protein OIU79_018336 [Salix purpurea]
MASQQKREEEDQPTTSPRCCWFWGEGSRTISKNQRACRNLSLMCGLHISLYMAV